MTTHFALKIAEITWKDSPYYLVCVDLAPTSTGIPLSPPSYAVQSRGKKTVLTAENVHTLRRAAAEADNNETPMIKAQHQLGKCSPAQKLTGESGST